MPVKASYWDAWYEACKDDYFAWGDGGYWDLPKYTADAYKGAGAANTNTAYTSCTKFERTYKSGKEVAEVMWGGSFTYETDEAKGYVMAFTDGQANPNNAIFADKAYPTVNAPARRSTSPTPASTPTGKPGARSPSSPARSTGTWRSPPVSTTPPRPWSVRHSWPSWASSSPPSP